MPVFDVGFRLCVRKRIAPTLAGKDPGGHHDEDREAHSCDDPVTIGLHASARRTFAQTTPNVVVQWNQILQTLYGSGPSNAQRSFSMMHIAMFDAINSIEEVYTPYRAHVRGSHGASAEAAAAMAARDVLTCSLPAQQATFDNALASQLAGIPPGRPNRARKLGGRLRWRFSNGGKTMAGQPRSPQIRRTCYRRFQVCGSRRRRRTVSRRLRSTLRSCHSRLLTSTQFLPSPPPTLTSARYAADLNETKRLGSVTSVDRTPEETLMAQVYAGVNTTISFLHVWNIVAGDIAQAPGPFAHRYRSNVRPPQRRPARRSADVVHEQVRLWAVAARHGDSASGRGSQSGHRCRSNVDAAC